MRNLFFLFFALFLQGCAKQQSLSSVPEDKIDFDQLERIPLNEISDSLLGGKKYILLDMHDEELLFGAIHKVLCKNNRIYILDRKFNKLIVSNVNPVVLIKYAENKYNMRGEDFSDYYSGRLSLDHAT